MHTKSELEKMSLDALHALASKIGAEMSDDHLTQLYNILDKESEIGDTTSTKPAEQTEAAPKKRGRKKKEAVPETPAAETPVAEAEKPKKRVRKTKETQPSQPSADIAPATPVEEVVEEKPKKTRSKAKAKVEPVTAEVPTPANTEVAPETPAPKKRGRKSKAEKAEEAAQNVAPVKAEPVKPVETAPEKPVNAVPAKEEPKAQDSDIKIIQDIRPSGPLAGELFKNAEPAQQPSEPQEEEKQPSSPTEKSFRQEQEQKREPAFDFGDSIIAEGVLEVLPDNSIGFLRSSDYNYLPSPDDVMITPQQIRSNGLKTGDVVRCTTNVPYAGERYFSLRRIISINGCNPQVIRDRSPFEGLTPLFPDEKFRLCSGNHDPQSVRIVDLFAPIGKGQRALIVAQPKTGKTILMKEIANAIARNHPEAYLIMLLIDERPEEVTDMARTVNAEVVASTFDEPAENHVHIAGLVLEKAKRMVECGHDVVIFLDSITRLARAYNTVAPASGKILSGGVDANALHKPKRFFGAARNIEGGGSLTIIATALTDTGSKMDEVIFEEFKGTGNMELQLDRTLANKRIFPAVNIVQSSTRRDDLLQDKMTLDRMWILRKFLSDMNPIEAMTETKQRIERTQTNEEFLMSMNS